MLLLGLQIGARDASADPPTGGALARQQTLVVSIAGKGQVPADAVGAALNVTVTNPVAPGFLTVYPCSDVAPVVSNLNYVAGQTVPNSVLVGVDADGDVCIDTLATTDIVVDVSGYIPFGSPLVPLTQPERFLDTRDGIGAPRARVGAGKVLQVPLAGRAGVPASSTMVGFNVTVVNPAGDGFVTVFPCGQPVPETSTINFRRGQTIPNLTVAAIGDGGAVCLYSTVAADLVGDVAAFLTGGSTGLTNLSAPRRVLDTRIGLGGPQAPIASDVRPLQVAGVAGVPQGATAAVVNLTATGSAGSGFAAAFPCGVGIPLVSNLNFAAGESVANGAIVALAADGTLCFTANTPVDIVVDVAGFVTGTASFVPITPTRIVDTREGVEPPCEVGVDVRHDITVNPPMNRFDLYDLRTGQLLGRPVGLPGMQSASAHITADCHVRITGIVGSSWASFDFLGSGQLVSSQQRQSSGYHTVRTSAGSVELTDGPDFAARFVDLTTNQSLFSIPERPTAARTGGPGGWQLLGITADRSVFAVAAIALDGPRFDVHFYDGSGGLLFVRELEFGVTPLAMSPNGAYLLTYRLDRRIPEYEITTISGAVVAIMPFSAFISTIGPQAFVTSGVVLGCVDDPKLGLVARRWDIFTPPKPIVAARPDLPCLDEAF